ncbi:hypothetical protein Mesil_2937 [Allomeiothermus silvanus DSM 9946]|uniref:Uncharacterized protein n=1 Tax=Allomeiothermus silvanus (strain ATCC 700542 / DSM 9946 / NBRC 106475 / NCIMB 13440 / VI-R2) TaxID=526227 RepID=D7BDF7_ALLS1|nr:hypothetical protein [Allomeiothermus silvanus]ADH64777.1 hypothetical protein Mesil_2937 [Allomeiothermus silvanus DSM 9946]
MNPTLTHPTPKPQEQIAQALANLEAWLETMRQPGGYGGPVCHWWQHRLRYTGPGHDWRYEGILVGYFQLWQKTGDRYYREKLNRAAFDLLEGQLPDGRYLASRFELNPGTLGTPHEAAATLGLLLALPGLDDPERALAAAGRNLDNLIAQLYLPEEKAYRDRVPNKLATLAQALLAYAEATQQEQYLPYATRALEQALRYQVQEGPLAGAIHQYAPTSDRGDGRFFPYYQSRCIPPLVEGARVLGEPRYGQAARQTLGFIERTRQTDGGWPMVLYAKGKSIERPRWIAANADVLLAYRALGEPLPEAALDRLLQAQLKSGGFPTAYGFGNDKLSPHDLIPVAGWNDKVFRLLAELLPKPAALPAPQVGLTEVEVWVGNTPAWLCENTQALIVQTRGEVLYAWRKGEPWARIVDPRLDVR